MTDRDFTYLGGETVFEGRIISLERARFRFTESGDEVQREIVHHPGAVGIVAYDEEHVCLVRQPREAADDPDMLELPAGKLESTTAGSAGGGARREPPEATGRRELAEEIGKAAETWEHLTTFFTSVGVLDEQLHLFLATGLSDVEQPEVDEEERIEIVPWPLSDLDGAIAATRDSKTLVGLLMLKDRLQA